MYGTRDAAQNWEREFSSKVLLWGFTKGVASPCIFYHKNRHIHVYVNGDDFVAVGDNKEVKWLQSQLSSVYDMKAEIMGDGVNEMKQQQILNRIVTWCKHSIEYEADPRHAEILARLDNKGQGAKVPGCKYAQDREQSQEVSQQDGTRYRAATAKYNFLAIDRPDIQFSSKEASKYMSSPRQSDWDMVIKLARYLRTNPRKKHVFPIHCNDNLQFIDVFADSDWAGDNINRKSTTGVVIKFGGCLIKTYSRNQKTIALSSAEAEFYAIVSGIAEGIGVQSILRDYGIDCAIRCFSDSSAAVGIVKRTGIGRVRHLQTQYLWVQELINNGKVSIHKVGTNSNPADLLTKYLDSNKMHEHLQRIGIHDSHNRPTNAPKTIGNVDLHARGRSPRLEFNCCHFGRNNKSYFNDFNNFNNNHSYAYKYNSYHDYNCNNTGINTTICNNNFLDKFFNKSLGLCCGHGANI